jgi:hypothetical protein
MLEEGEGEKKAEKMTPIIFKGLPINGKALNVLLSVSSSA